MSTTRGCRQSLHLPLVHGRSGIGVRALAAPCDIATALAATIIPTDNPSPADRDDVASASNPVNAGPIACPTANTIVKPATAVAHAALGSAIFTRSATA